MAQKKFVTKNDHNNSAEMFFSARPVMGFGFPSCPQEIEKKETKKKETEKKFMLNKEIKEKEQRPINQFPLYSSLNNGT